MRSYPKILNIGDPALTDLLFKGPVQVEEKIDGSQFRFGIFEGQRQFGSKGIVYDDTHPTDQMFQTAVVSANAALDKLVAEINPAGNIQVICEFLKSPHHNTLTYARTPKNNLVLLDIYTADNWASAETREKLGKIMDLEVVPILAIGEQTLESIKNLLETKSFLGETTIEGIVVKNYRQVLVLYGKGQPCFGKFVREQFREMNKKEWHVGESIQSRILDQFPKEPRWVKVVQHLRDEGKLQNTPKDFALLIPGLLKDFEEEAESLSKDMLWNHYKREISHGILDGFVDWYKGKLLESAFEEKK